MMELLSERAYARFFPFRFFMTTPAATAAAATPMAVAAIFAFRRLAARPETLSASSDDLSANAAAATLARAPSDFAVLLAYFRAFLVVFSSPAMVTSRLDVASVQARDPM